MIVKTRNSLNHKTIFLLSLIFSVLFFMGCSENIEENSASIEKNASQQFISVFLESPSNSSARSAMPSRYCDDGGDLIFAGTVHETYYSSGNLQVGTFDAETNKLTIPMPYSTSKRSNMKLEIYGFPSDTEITPYLSLSRESALIYAEITGLEIPAEAFSISIEEKITMKPYNNSRTSGKIDLDISFPDTYTLAVKASDKNNNYNSSSIDSEKLQLSNPNSSPCKLTAEDVYSGTYSLQFSLLKDEIPIYSWTETINVYPGITTDRWNSDMGEVDENGARVISPSKIKTDFYVCGSNNDNQTSWFQIFKNYYSYGNDNGTGSISEPYRTIQKALESINSINDGSTQYTVFVDGRFWDSSSKSDYLADFSIFGSNSANISIKGLGIIKAVFEKGFYNDGCNIKLENCEINLSYYNNNIGNGIYNNNGNIILSGAVKIKNDSDNYHVNIYLNNDTFITIAGELTEKGTVAEIVLPTEKYVSGTKVLQAGEGVTITEDICNKFVLLDATGTETSTAKIVPSADGKTGVLGSSQAGSGGGIYPPSTPENINLRINATNGGGGTLTVSAENADTGASINSSEFECNLELYFNSFETGITSTTNEIEIPVGHQTGSYVIKAAATYNGSTYSSEFTYNKET